MKNKLLYIPCCFLLIAVSGCNKFLEKEPDNRAKLTSPEKVSQLLGTAYPQSNYQAFAETMSDNVEDIGTLGTDATLGDAYFFRDSKETQQDSPEAYWFACYTSIAAANQALKTIGLAADPGEYKNQKGEALVARAYSHFMLATFFSKAYNTATAATDPGIPYVTEPENVVIKQYERKTVQYTYDMIEKDLLEGIALIEDKVYDIPKYHFNVAAAAAFACRFYLFKKDYAKVIQYAEQAIPGGNYASFLRGWNDPTSPYNTIVDVGELFKVYATTTESTNLLLVETSSLWSRNYYSNRWGYGDSMSNIISPSPDVLTGKDFQYKQYGIAEFTHLLVPKIDEYFVRTTVDANFGQPYVMVPLFASEEVLFNHAEALFFTGNKAGAITLLNMFASRRARNYNAGTDSFDETDINTAFPQIAGNNTTDGLPSIVQAILYYKRMDYVHEGMRWFDILRYDLPVKHYIRQNDRIVDSVFISGSDPRRVMQLPQITTQAGLEPNLR